MERIPLAPFQERFRELQARGVTASEIALRCGWHDRGHADPSRVLRALGLMPNGRGTKGPPIRKTIRYETAEKLADALGLDFWEVGL